MVDLISTSLLTQLLILAIVLYGIIVGTRKSKSVSIALFVVLPFLLIPLFMQTEWNGWFNVAKSATMIFVGLYLTAMRYKWRSRPFTIFFVVLFMLNIVEATLRDFQSGHMINGLAGVFVLLMLPAFSALRVDDKGEMTYPTTWSFIIAYSLWNFTFLYAYVSFRGFAGDHTLIAGLLLLVPMFYALRQGREIYTQARGYTLAFCITLQEATGTQWPQFWPLAGDSVFSASVHVLLSVFTLGFAVSGLLYLWFKQRDDFRLTILGKIFSSIDITTNESAAQAKG